MPVVRARLRQVTAAKAPASRRDCRVRRAACGVSDLARQSLARAGKASV